MFWVKFVLIVAILVTLGIMILLFIAQKTGQKAVNFLTVKKGTCVVTFMLGKARKVYEEGFHPFFNTAS